MLRIDCEYVWYAYVLEKIDEKIHLKPENSQIDEMNMGKGMTERPIVHEYNQRDGNVSATVDVIISYFTGTTNISLWATHSKRCACMHTHKPLCIREQKVWRANEGEENKKQKKSKIKHREEIKCVSGRAAVMFKR